MATGAAPRWASTLPSSTRTARDWRSRLTAKVVPMSRRVAAPAWTEKGRASAATTKRASPRSRNRRRWCCVYWMRRTVSALRSSRLPSASSSLRISPTAVCRHSWRSMAGRPSRAPQQARPASPAARDWRRLRRRGLRPSSWRHSSWKRAYSLEWRGSAASQASKRRCSAAEHSGRCIRSSQPAACSSTAGRGWSSGGVPQADMVSAGTGATAPGHGSGVFRWH